jgi:hypothetical protein
VKVHVVYDLPSLGSHVAGDAVAALAVTRAFSQEPSGLEAASHHGGVVGAEAGERLDVPPGDDQEVEGGLGVDVLEGEDLIVLVLDIGGCLAGYDAAEYAVGAHESPCVGVYSFPVVARVGGDSKPRRN